MDTRETLTAESVADWLENTADEDALRKADMAIFVAMHERIYRDGPSGDVEVAS